MEGHSFAAPEFHVCTLCQNGCRNGMWDDVSCSSENGICQYWSNLSLCLWPSHIIFFTPSQGFARVMAITWCDDGWTQKNGIRLHCAADFNPIEKTNRSVCCIFFSELCSNLWFGCTQHFAGPVSQCTWDLLVNWSLDFSPLALTWFGRSPLGERRATKVHPAPRSKWKHLIFRISWRICALWYPSELQRIGCWMLRVLPGFR